MTGYILSPKHPRYFSLYWRDVLAMGVKKGITSLQGVTAHGRGEAFDYLIGEKTYPFAVSAIEASAALLLLAHHPVLSVNGNTAILAPREIISLARLINAKIEVNLFHFSKSREKKIASYLKSLGAKEVLLPDKTTIDSIESNRRKVNKEGQKIADVIFVPLEDGDRAEKLRSLGKKIITIDLNPLSRTASFASITIVDNIVRALPLLLTTVAKFKNYPKSKLHKIVKLYDNKTALKKAFLHIRSRLLLLSKN